MKVFISWSGERSRLVAEALRYWLPKVIQAIQPWMSANDIEKGTRWRAGVANELEQSSVGIICLTPENLSSTWIHFEAGALSKQHQNTYVCTFLYELDPADVREPLAQFQTTKALREDVRRLIQTINNSLGDKKLPEAEINESFDVWWPKLERRLNSIPLAKSNPEPQRAEREILEEILGLVRSQSRGDTEFNSEVPRHNRSQIHGSHLLPADIKRLSDYYGASPSMITASFFDEDEIIKLISRLRREEKSHHRKVGVVVGDRDIPIIPTTSEEENNEDTHP